MAEATITSKRQVTIPQEVMKALDLKEGEKIVFIVEGKKAAIVPKNPLKALKELKKEIMFNRKELDEMIKESKKEWSKFG